MDYGGAGRAAAGATCQRGKNAEVARRPPPPPPGKQTRRVALIRKPQVNRRRLCARRPPPPKVTRAQLALLRNVWQSSCAMRTWRPCEPPKAAREIIALRN